MACGYSHYLPWWPVNDDNSVFFDFILRFLGVFLMPTLFFIAGYFALPSVQRKGAGLFVKSKLIRLGIPLLIGAALLGPIRTYIYEYSRGYEELNLWRLFVINIKDAVILRTGILNSVYQFSHLHLWFLSLLLAFFIVFAFIHHIKRHRSEVILSERLIEQQSSKSIYSVLTLSGVTATLMTLIMFRLFYETAGREPWVVIASVVQFQPTRVCLYGICFGLGIYAFHNNWFSSSKIPGNPMTWLVLTLALWFAKELVLSMLLSRFTMTLGVTHITLRSFLVFSTIMTIVAFGGRFWQSDSNFNRLLAKNSYTIYLIHLVIVLMIQMVMYKWWDVSIYLKFGIGSILSLILSYSFSEFMVRRYPQSSVAAMVGLFALLAFILKSG